MLFVAAAILSSSTSPDGYGVSAFVPSELVASSLLTARREGGVDRNGHGIYGGVSRVGRQSSKITSSRTAQLQAPRRCPRRRTARESMSLDQQQQQQRDTLGDIIGSRGGQGAREEDGLPELSHDEVRRYSRHLILSDVGVNGQRMLKASSVLAVGTGGLGSPALLYLAAAGVGRLGIVDDDIVDESNLQRQVGVSESGVFITSCGLPF